MLGVCAAAQGREVTHRAVEADQVDAQNRALGHADRAVESESLGTHARGQGHGGFCDHAKGIEALLAIAGLKHLLGGELA